MPQIENTDPKIDIRDFRNGNNNRREAYFSLRTWSLFLGCLAIATAGAVFVLGLMYFPRSEGEALRSDVDHHVESADRIHTDIKDDIKEAKEEDKNMLKEIQETQKMLWEFAPEYKRRAYERKHRRK